MEKKNDDYKLKLSKKTQIYCGFWLALLVMIFFALDNYRNWPINIGKYFSENTGKIDFSIYPESLFEINEDAYVEHVASRAKNVEIEKHFGVYKGLVILEGLSEGCYQKLLDIDNHYINVTMAKLANLPKNIYMRLANVEDYEVLFTLAQNRNASWEVFPVLAEMNNKFPNHRSLFVNSFVPTDAIAYLYMDSREVLRAKIAENPDIPKTVIDYYANEEKSKFVLSSLISNRAFAPSKEQIDRILKLSPEILIHPNVPEDMIRSYYEKGYSRYVAENPSTPVDILNDLAFYEGDEIRAIVAKNSATPQNILRALIHDRSSNVRYCTRLTKGLLIEAMGNSYESVRSNLAESKLATKEMLNVLADDSEDSIRWRVADSLNTDPATLAKMAKTETDPITLDYLAGNPNLPRFYLKLFAVKDDHSARLNLAKNPSLDSEVIDILLERGGDKILRALVDNPNTQFSHLQKIAKQGYSLQATVKAKLKMREMREEQI